MVQSRPCSRKGLKDLRKAYGSQGYINMVATPMPRLDEAKKLIYWNIDIDEGKQFYVSRIEFTGNTITRDKVIRRELLLEEGQVYSSQRWDLSILRLNQLSYFDVLKADDDTETRQNADDGTVDLLLKLKEKGKNSIGVNGGISGLSGTFIGLNYETNNFLGLGETLSANAEHRRPVAQPELRLQRAVSAQQADLGGHGGIRPEVRLQPGQGVLDRQRRQRQRIDGAAVAADQLQHIDHRLHGIGERAAEASVGRAAGVTRVGVTYALVAASVTTFNDNTRNVFQSLAFRSGVAGPNQLNGIVTSTISPSFSYSSLDRPVGPHSGRDFNVSVQIAGAGGNVKYISPVASFRQFYPMKGLKINREGHNVLGMRLQLAHVNGFGGEVAPPTNRIYGGGENDVRGFDIRSSRPTRSFRSRCSST